MFEAANVIGAAVGGAPLWPWRRGLFSQPVEQTGRYADSSSAMRIASGLLPHFRHPFNSSTIIIIELKLKQVLYLGAWGSNHWWPVALRVFFWLVPTSWISMSVPTVDCLHFGFWSVCEQHPCYTTYFCLFACMKRQVQIWKTTPPSPLDTQISQPVVALLPVNGWKMVSGGKGGAFLFEMLSLPGKEGLQGW